VSDDLPASEQPEPRPNPIASGASISVSLPETVAVRLVDASALGDYELWSLMASIVGSAATGFLVAFVQACAATKRESELSSTGAPASNGEAALLADTVLFTVLFLVCLVAALGKRKQLFAKSKKLKFALGSQILEDDAD